MNVNEKSARDRRYDLAVIGWQKRAARELTGAVLINQMILEARSAGDRRGRVTELREQRRLCEVYYLRAVEVLESNGEEVPADLTRDADYYFGEVRA